MILLKKLILLLAACLLFTCSYAESVWILCQPDSFVNLRPFANKSCEPEARMECSTKLETDNKTKNGYLYVTDTSSESGCGWVHKGYVVYSEPIRVMRNVNVFAKGRIACRRTINGTRRCWIHDGDVVMAYFISKEWAVTNKGFIQTRYLGVDYEQLAKNSARIAANGESTSLHYEDE